MKKLIFVLPRKMRRVIAKRTKKQYTINILSEDKDVYVIENLGENPYTPRKKLQYLLDRSDDYGTEGKKRIYRAVAKNHNVNFGIIDDLMEYHDETVKCNIARNIGAVYYYWQLRLAYDPSKYVRYKVGVYTIFPYIMDMLLKDPDPFVRSGVAYNKFLRAAKQKEISDKEKDLMTIIALLQNPNVIPEVLDEHSNGGNDERINVAAHLNTRIETLERLKKDKLREVRKMAKYNLKHKKKIMKYSWKFIM